MAERQQRHPATQIAPMGEPTSQPKRRDERIVLCNRSAPKADGRSRGRERAVVRRVHASSIRLARYQLVRAPTARKRPAPGSRLVLILHGECSSRCMPCKKPPVSHSQWEISHLCRASDGPFLRTAVACGSTRLIRAQRATGSTSGPRPSAGLRGRTTSWCSSGEPTSRRSTPATRPMPS